MLKNSLKSGSSESNIIKSELKNLQNVLKVKDKEIYNLEAYKYNNQEAIKNVKQDAKEQKTEKEKHLRQMKTLEKKIEQAGAELGQAQLKLELDFTLIFFRFGLIELTGWYSCS